MHKQIKFTRTDGDRSTWPTCGKTADGGRLDHFRSDDAHVVQYLERLASRLVEHLNYPGK